MKKNQILAFLLIVFISTFAGCEDTVNTTRTYTAYSPVYLSFDDLRASVKVSPKGENTKVKNPGKIYFKDNYIFLNEYGEGIHVFDNSEPANPEHVAFIEIPGNVDMAIRNNILFADSYVDLVSLDISNIEDIEEVHREKDIFPYVLPQHDYTYPTAQFDESEGVIVDWEVKKVTETVEYNPNKYYFLAKNTMDFAYAEAGGVAPTVGVSTGVGGSMARFIVYGNTLYVLKSYELEVFDVVNETGFSSVKKIDMNRVAETVFIANRKLFIGTQTGMEIYDLASPESPTYISDFNHVQSCDPVVVQGDIAYVTLRSGTFCGGFNNQLDVIDISNISSPQLIKSYPMTSPHGLGISGNTLFICDGNDGLKIYDASNSETIAANMIKHIPDFKAIDVIPLPNVLLALAEDGIYQYDYSNLDNITLLSQITVEDE